MALMYKPNPVILLADDDGTVFFSIVPSALPLTTGDLFDLRRQAEEVGLQLLVVESVAVDSLAWLEDEIVWAAHRRDAAATAPRTVRGLLAKGVSYMDDLSIGLRIAHGFDDGLKEGEPFGTLTPEAMAQRLRFRLADYDRQRELPTSRPGSRNFDALRRGGEGWMRGTSCRKDGGMGMFNSAGIMWSPQLVGWGYQGPNPTCELLGYYAAKLKAYAGKGALSEAQRKRQTLNFWDVPGVYALYKGDTTVYVGQASKIGDRLLSHYRADHLVGRWDAFSWVSPVDLVEKIDPAMPVDIDWVPLAAGSPASSSFEHWLDEIEALMILLAKPLDNRQIPSFGDHAWIFTQVRSEHADATQSEMIEKLYTKLVLGK